MDKSIINQFFKQTSSKTQTILKTICNSNFKNLPKVCFISTDGDLISYKSLMKIRIINKNMFPIFAESTLKTWIITDHYSGQKAPILNDCYNIMDVCDEICLILNTNIQSISFSNFAEGIQLELEYWLKNKLRPISFCPINSNNKDCIFTEIDKTKIKKSLNSYLLQKQNKKTAFIFSDHKYHKHTDWMTKYTLNKGYVPLSAWDLITKSEFEMCNKTLIDQIVYFFSLAKNCDYILFFTPTETFKDMDEISYALLYLLINYNPKIKIINKSFVEIKIPKYVDSKRWAITTKEKNLIYI